MTRKELRETSFLLLFRLVFFSEDEMTEQIKFFFSGEDAYSEAEKEYIENKVLSCSRITESIDAQIDRVSIGWKTKRMSRVDLTILRLAYYEMVYDESVPVATAINEAVELAKMYGTENSGSFVNGILAKLV